MEKAQIKNLRVPDNSKKAREQFSEINSLTNKIANKTFSHLEKEGVFIYPTLKESEDIRKDQMVLKRVNETYLTGNVVGFLGYKNERLTITSRFSSEQEDYFFQYIISKAMEFPNVFKLLTDSNQKDKLFNYLIFLFPYYLKAALRKGIYQRYIRHVYNDEDVKGIIDFARHIKVNTPFLGKFAYSRREFVCDNPLTQLIRHTIEFLKTRKIGKTVLSGIKKEVELIEKLTTSYNFFDRRKVIHSNFKNTVRHAFYQEYRGLQRLCLMILNHQKHQIGSGDKPIYGILFDVSWLWEEYIYTLIKDNYYHPRNRARKEGNCQWLFKDEKGDLQGQIYPDFIGNDDKRRKIADAKYKEPDNVKGHDYLQLLAYMYRFEAKNGYFIYPDKENPTKSVYRLNRGSTFDGRKVEARDDVSVTKLGLKIPESANSFSDFENQIHKSETEFCKALNLNPQDKVGTRAKPSDG